MVATVAVTHRVFLASHAKHFRALGWTVDALAAGATECPECQEAFDQTFDICFSRNLADVWRLLRAALRVREVVEGGSYDIVHVHTPIAAFLSRLALRRYFGRGIFKIVYTAHGFHFHKGQARVANMLFISLERLAGRWTDHIVVINREDERAAIEHNLAHPSRIHYVPGVGVDLQVFNPERVPNELIHEFRRSHNLSAEQILFLMIAEFSPGKRHRDALQALAVLGRRDITLVLAGNGALETQIRDLTLELGLTHQVLFLGFRKDIPILIRASRATILPSEREGLPRSLMESLALEVPAIATDIRGARDLITSRTGLLVPLGRPERIADAMEFLAANPDTASQMGREGRLSMSAYDLREVLRRHELLYAEILGRTRTTGWKSPASRSE